MDIYTLDEFVAWLLVDEDIKTCTIHNSALHISALSRLFENKYIVTNHSIGVKTCPWTLKLRRKTEADELVGRCTCETPYCHIWPGERHV